MAQHDPNNSNDNGGDGGAKILWDRACPRKGTGEAKMTHSHLPTGEVFLFCPTLYCAPSIWHGAWHSAWPSIVDIQRIFVDLCMDAGLLTPVRVCVWLTCRYTCMYYMGLCHL